jgi:hypothetical protein
MHARNLAGLWTCMLALLLLQSACLRPATGAPLGGQVLASNYRHPPMTPSDHPDSRERWEKARADIQAQKEALTAAARSETDTTEALVVRGEANSSTERSGEGSRPRRTSPGTREVGPLDDWDEEGFGWPDGVGDGRPHAVPMSLDWFQGFLVEAGVPSSALPEDGRTLSPEQAMELLPHLLATPVTLGNFGPRRMAAHLLLEVATEGSPVSRDELHARMRRFARLLVLRTDGYLVKPATGVAVQKVGEVFLAEDGTLRASHFEVGPFYTIGGERLFPVDARLEVPAGTRSVGPYEPDDGVFLPVAEGAMLAVVDTVEGLHRLVFHTDETLQGLMQLPGVAHELYKNAPQHWEEFRHKPHAEKVRTMSRLATSAVLVVGTSGTGAAKAASWGGKLGNVSVPLLSLSGEGVMAVRLVAVPVGGVISATAPALSATYILHMARTGAQGGGGGGGAWPPSGGPGQWVRDTASMSEQSRAYQAQVTGAPKGWAYKVCRNGECAEYDGFDHKTGTLLEAKAREYDKWFNPNLDAKFTFKGLKDLQLQAEKQARLAGGARVRWHVAEPRMVAILQKYFKEWRITGIEVVHTPPLP